MQMPGGMPGGGGMPPQGQPQPGPAQAGGGEGDLLTVLVEALMQMWSQTGEVMGQPAPSEEIALQLAQQAAIERLGQLQQAQAQGPPQGGQQMNPMMAALQGGGM